MDISNYKDENRLNKPFDEMDGDEKALFEILVKNKATNIEGQLRNPRLLTAVVRELASKIANKDRKTSSNYDN